MFQPLPSGVSSWTSSTSPLAPLASLIGASSRHRMRWFRISSVPVRDRRAGWYRHPPGRWFRSGSPRLRADLDCTAAPCGCTGQPHPNVPPHFPRRENNLYVLPLSGFPQNVTPAARYRPDTPVGSGASVSFEGLLEARMRISAAPTASGPRRGRADGGATVPLVEVGARGERHPCSSSSASHHDSESGCGPS